jgi:hypothetical protein
VYFLLGLALVDCCVLCFRKMWIAYDPNEYRERLESCRRQAWDLVLIGGSPMAEDLDPAQLAGLYWHGATLSRNFNLGLAGATTTTIWHAVEHGLVHPPRLLIYGISATDVNDSRDERNGVWTLMDLPDVADWVRQRPETGWWCVRHFISEQAARFWSLYYYRNAIRLWLADYGECFWPGTSPNAALDARYGLRFSAALQKGNGFAPRFENEVQTLADLKAMNLVEPRFRYLEDFRLGGHLRYLHRILDWADQRGVEVVLIDMPVAAEVEAQFPQAFAAYRTVLAEVAHDRGVCLLRPTREAVGLDDCLFADRVHLNARGRERFGAWVRARLTELGSGATEGLHGRN